ncbi:MAG: hypothetical protein LM601_03370 [Candidatus Verstraetearchaeota archaeon]|nr:hypothetical protein [Candidatus Verstraetearchaeota archaeon]
MYRQSKLLLTLIIMAVCLISAFDFSLSGVPPTEFFRIIVTSNGDVGVLISNYRVGLPEEFPRIPVGTKVSNYVSLTYNIGNELTGKVSLDLTGMGEAEADAEFQKIKNFLEGWLRCKIGSINKLIRSRTSQYLGYLMWVEYDFKAENFNPDVLIDKFMSLTPSEGFFVMVNKKIISPGNYFYLTVYGGSNYAQLAFTKAFENYFNFKVGETYTLDVFKILNFTGSIKIPSNYCEIQIELLTYPPSTGPLNIQAEIVKVDLPYEFSIGKSANPDHPTSFIIYNVVKGEYTLRAGQTIEYMRVTFKIVEAGFNISNILSNLNLTTITGLLIVALCISIPILLIRMLKMKRCTT